MLTPLPFKFTGHQMLLGESPKIMGILNVTPDSFSDGGKYQLVEQAVAHAREMLEQGADFLDIGGESTRPGYTPVPAREEIERVVPVIQAIRAFTDCPISVDTSKAEVAEAALAAGADIINDITAWEDPDMPAVARKFQAGTILMHNSPLVTDLPTGEEVKQFLLARWKWACQVSGLEPEYFVFDPGVGFQKNQAQNLSLLRHCGDLRQSGAPVLLGMSNKSCLGIATGITQASQRIYATIGAAVCCLFSGCDIWRVHQVAASRQALQMAQAIMTAE